MVAKASGSVRVSIVRFSSIGDGLAIIVQTHSIKQVDRKIDDDVSGIYLWMRQYLKREDDCRGRHRQFHGESAVFPM